jgi:hypothetical protein
MIKRQSFTSLVFLDSEDFLFLSAFEIKSAQQTVDRNNPRSFLPILRSGNNYDAFRVW